MGEPVTVDSPVNASVKPEIKAGFDSPIPKSHKGPLGDHIDPDTRMAKGIDPDVGMVTVNLSVLQAKFGKKEGLDRYSRIARAGGFFDPNSQPSGSSFFPDLGLEGMDKDAREKVDAILNEKE